ERPRQSRAARPGDRQVFHRIGDARRAARGIQRVARGRRLALGRGGGRQINASTEFGDKTVTGDVVKHSTKHGDAARLRPAPAGGRIRALALPLAASVVAMVWLAPLAAAPAHARVIEVDGVGRSAAITIPVGKSDNVHTEGAFVDVVVADPETADVVPLT